MLLHQYLHHGFYAITSGCQPRSLRFHCTSRPFCYHNSRKPPLYARSQGIIQPVDGATITQVNDGNYDSTTVEIVYCSGQYFKTRSIDASVFLTFPDSPNSGELLAKDIEPDNKDASAGFYSYRFNVTIAPSDGSYPTGVRSLSVYETTTGEFALLLLALFGRES